MQMNFGEPLAVLVIVAAFLGIGRGAERLFGFPFDRTGAVFWLIAGWAFMTLAGVIAALGNFAVPNLSLAVVIAGDCAFFIFGIGDKNFRRTIPVFALALLLLSPLLRFAAETPATIFDEFGQWLPNARFLYEHRHFPTAADPNLWSFKPGYPPAMPIVIAAGSFLTNSLSETTGKLLTIVIGTGFGLILADLLTPRFGRWPALVAGVALATVLNPFFDPRIALTSYADAPTGFVLAATIFAVWNAVMRPNVVWLWRTAICVVLLILLRETNIVPVAGLFCGVAVLRRQVPAGKLAILIALSAAIPLLAWRIYLHIAEIPPAMTIRSMGLWDWDAPVTVLRTLLLDRLSGNPLLGGAAVLSIAVVIFAGWRFLRHSGREVTALILLLGAVAVAWLGFLAFAYIAVFSAPEVAHASSAWRYVSQLGPGILLALAAGFGKAVPVGQGRKSIALGVAILLIVFQCATWGYWRLDCRYADVVSVRLIARGLLASAAIGDAPLTVVNPVDGPAYAVQLDYDLHRPAGRSTGAATLDGAAADGAILDLTPVDRAAAYAARQSPAVSLFRRQGGALIPVMTLPAQQIDIK
jgi:hypothetical protein